MSGHWPGWYCPDCGANGDPEAERDADGTLVVRCPECDAITPEPTPGGGRRV